MFDKVSNTCYKSATTDGDNNCINIGKLFNDFKTYSTLTCDNIGIIERMNESISLFVTELNSLVVSIVLNALDHTHFSTVFLCGFNL